MDELEIYDLRKVFTARYKELTNTLPFDDYSLRPRLEELEFIYKVLIAPKGENSYDE